MKIKNIHRAILLVLTFHFCLPTSYSQSPVWQWAKSAGGSSTAGAIDDSGYGCATDAIGNIIVTGWFSGPTITFGTTVLNNVDSNDVFIVKYDAGGNVLWARSAGGTRQDRGYACATDPLGNIIVTGEFVSPTITFGATVLTNSGNSDMFIAKYDAAGNVLWANSAGGVADDYGISCATDSAGNIIVTGWLGGPDMTFGTTVLTGSYDMYVVKYDAAGNVLWAKSAGSTGDDRGNSCRFDNSGNIIVSGHYNSPAITFGTSVLSNAGSYDMFIVKYDTAGNMLWVNSAGGSGDDRQNSCTTDNAGNIIVSGGFRSATITFGTAVLTNANLNSDVYVVKYDTAGNTQWAKSAGGTSTDQAKSCATDAGNNIIVTGTFISTGITFGTTGLTNSGTNTADLFVVKYDTFGNEDWAKSAGGTLDEWVYGSATDLAGNFILTGRFTSSSISFGTTVLTNAGYYDIFIAKLDTLSIPTGISYPGNDAVQIWISPNPATSELKVRAGAYNAQGIEIYDAQGRSVLSFLTPPLQEGDLDIDLSNLDSGIYMVRIMSGQQLSTHKLIITK